MGSAFGDGKGEGKGKGLGRVQLPRPSNPEPVQGKIHSLHNLV